MLGLKQTLLSLKHRVCGGRDRRDLALLGPSRGLTATQDAPFAAYRCWEKDKTPISSSRSLQFLQDPSFPATPAPFFLPNLWLYQGMRDK